MTQSGQEKIQVVSSSLIKRLVKMASESPNGRAQWSLAGEQRERELIQSIVNAIQPESYMRPHKHENPDKTEIVTILKGRVALVYFNEDGSIFQTVFLEEVGPVDTVRTPPGIYHTSVSLEKDSAILSVIQGPYDKQTHKQPAPWAPAEEDHEAGQKYLQQITSSID